MGRSFSKDPVEGSLESESIRRSPIEKQAKNNQVGCDSNEDSGLDVDMSEVTSCEKGKSSSEVKNDDESITAAEIPSKMKKKKKRKVKDRDEDVMAPGTENTEEVSEKK